MAGARDRLESILGLKVPPFKWKKLGNSPNEYVATYEKHDVRIRHTHLNRAKPLWSWSILVAVNKGKGGWRWVGLEGESTNLRVAKTKSRYMLLEHLKGNL